MTSHGEKVFLTLQEPQDTELHPPIVGSSVPPPPKGCLDSLVVGVDIRSKMRDGPLQGALEQKEGHTQRRPRRWSQEPGPMPQTR